MTTRPWTPLECRAFTVMMFIGAQVAWLSVHSQWVWQSRGSSLASITKLLEQRSEEQCSRLCMRVCACVEGEQKQALTEDGRPGGFRIFFGWESVGRPRETHRKSQRRIQHETPVLPLFCQFRRCNLNIWAENRKYNAPCSIEVYVHVRQNNWKDVFNAYQECNLCSDLSQCRSTQLN